MNPIIGIDLGTSNSAAAVIRNMKPFIIQALEGPSISGKAFPSIVAFKDNKILVGEIARRQMSTNPEGTISGAKRKMGTNFKFTDKQYTPEQISAFILSKIKKDAESFLGETMDKAVITVPAYFNDNQRRATKDAAEIAGLQVVRIINEPTAASLAFGLDKVQKDLKIVVFDLGGGTLDVTVMEMGGGIFQVKSTSGDTQLGGTDMDNTLIDYVLQEFKKQSGLDIKNDKVAMARIKEAVEEAKIRLSFIDSIDINLPFIAYDPRTGPKNFVLSITRHELEEILQPIIERCRAPMLQALQDAKLTPPDIDKIILVGGPTRMPIIRQSVTKIMGKEPDTAIDPMEAVAMGAAIQGAIIAGDLSTDILLVDVTPLTVGVEVSGGLREPIIERSTTIPTKKSKQFTTATDNQTSVTIHVVQGEEPKAADCVSLGLFKLSGIALAPRRVPRIEVAFDIDANGVLNVTAKDLATDKEAKITVSENTRLSKDQVEKLRRELQQSEGFASVDQQKDEILKELDPWSIKHDNLVSSLGKALGAVGNMSQITQKDRENKNHNDSNNDVTLKHEQNTINFTKGEKVIETITEDKLKKLDYESQRLIKAYEQSMIKHYNLWVEVYPKLANKSDTVDEAKVAAEVDDIVRKMCDDLNNIVNFLKNIGIDLTDKYPPIKYLCRQIEHGNKKWEQCA